MLSFVYFLFFKEKMAFDMRMSDLSSDVFSSDHDKGSKLFEPDGYKLSDEDEMKIEAMLEQEIPLAASQDIGRARRVEDARGRYIHAVKSSLPAALRLDGLKLVVDCAIRSAYPVAPSAFWALGAVLGRASGRSRVCRSGEMSG